MTDSRLKIVIDKGPAAGTDMLLVRTITIGRDAGVDLVLPGDEFVSLRHAQITAGNGGPRLRNLSPNGTLVNGRAVSDAALNAGDRISIGLLHLLTVRAAAAGSDASIPLGAQPVGTGRTAQTPHASAARGPARSAASNAIARGAFRVPAWLVVYLIIVSAALVFFGVKRLRTVAAPGLSQIRLQEEQYGAAHQRAPDETARVVRLLETAAVHERRGDRRSAYETYREALAVRRPIAPQSPAYRYAAARLAALGPK